MQKQTEMANPDLELNERDEEILAVLRDEGRVTPYLVRQRTGYDKGDVNTTLAKFARHGWISQVTRGLYEFKEDPRE